jgi:hypothetical protein
VVLEKDGERLDRKCEKTDKYYIQSRMKGTLYTKTQVRLIRLVIPYVGTAFFNTLLEETQNEIWKGREDK